jgi:hypothetical protein
MSLLWKILVFDEDTESADIATNENNLIDKKDSYLISRPPYLGLQLRSSALPFSIQSCRSCLRYTPSLVATSADSVPSSYLVHFKWHMHWYDSNIWTYHKEITNYNWKMYMKEKIRLKKIDKMTVTDHNSIDGERENLILKIAKNKNKNTLLNQSWCP